MKRKIIRFSVQCYLGDIAVQGKRDFFLLWLKPDFTFLTRMILQSFINIHNRFWFYQKEVQKSY